jgi:hypothetical protein
MIPEVRGAPAFFVFPKREKERMMLVNFHQEDRLAAQEQMAEQKVAAPASRRALPNFETAASGNDA